MRLIYLKLFSVSKMGMSATTIGIVVPSPVSMEDCMDFHKQDVDELRISEELLKLKLKARNNTCYIHAVNQIRLS